MFVNALLLILLATASLTDWRQRKIPNWLTYTGAAMALLLNAVANFSGIELQSVVAARSDSLGLIGLPESLAGLAFCGGIMLVCYVFFPGGVGGGDVKLLAMVGAFVGVYVGLEVILWTFLVGGLWASLRLIWQFGAAKIISRSAVAAYRALRMGTLQLSREERRPLQTPLLLAPCATLAVVMVQLRLLDFFSY